MLRAEGLTELVGDIVLTCVGGDAPSLGAAIPTADFTITFGTNVTSRLLGYTSSPLTASNTSEPLLLIDEPGSGLMIGPVDCSGPYSGPLNVGPGAPQKLCGASGTPYSAVGAGYGGCVQYARWLGGDFVMSSSSDSYAEPANVFAGVVNATQVAFYGIPILPPATAGAARVFRMTNIRVNANALWGLGTVPVFASISTSISGVSVPDQTVGFVQPGLAFQVRTPGNSAVLATPDFSGCTTGAKCPYGILRFSENFGTAFKTRVSPTFTTNGQSSSPGPGPYQPAGSSQNIPGMIYNSESGFISPLIFDQLGAVAGLADFGTRLKAEFSNIPTGVRIYVATSNVANLSAPPPGNACTSFFAQCTPFAQLVTGETAIDGDGSTPSVPAAGPIAWNGTPALYGYALVSGSGTAVWEVVNTMPWAPENYDFPVWIVFDPGVTPAALNITGSVAPNPDDGAFSILGGGLAQGATYPVPRFASSGVTPQSIIGDMKFLQASGAITLNTNSLLAKLNNALAERKSGKCGPAGNVYAAFIHEVMAQTGKGITSAAAAILIADAQYLEAHCP
ncbi:MAG: hypothetical protein ABSH44_07590 [Bryobacteraceae bacterium]|jgi:hypothetical protein